MVKLILFKSEELSFYHVFFDFVLKIRLIRLGFFFKKTKIPVFELTTY